MKTEKGQEFKNVSEAQEKLSKLIADQDSFLKDYKNEDGSFKTDVPLDKLTEARNRNADIKDIRGLISSQGEMKQFEEAAKYGNEPVKKDRFGAYKGLFGAGIDTNETKSIGEAFVESKEYKNAKGSFTNRPNIIFSQPNATGGMALSNWGNPYYKASDADPENTMFAPPNFRLPLVVSSAQRPTPLLAIVPQIQTSERNAIKYMLETTFDNQSAAAAETTALGQSNLNWTEQSSTIQTIGTFIAIDEQQMEDVPAVIGMINNRGTLMMDQTIETELISGSGTSPHLKGYTNAVGLLTQAKGSDDIYTAVANGINKVRWTGYVEPDYIVMNSTDVQKIRTGKNAIGNFIWGAPNQNSMVDNIWGLPIVTTNGITAGTALVGAFRAYSARYMARGLTIEVGRINDNFITLQYAIRFTERETLVVHRGTAFCTVTGL